jgi:hypothetical protein
LVSEVEDEPTRARTAGPACEIKHRHSSKPRRARLQRSAFKVLDLLQ